MVAVDIFDVWQFSVVEVTSADEHTMLVRVKNTLNFICLIAGNAPV